MVRRKAKKLSGYYVRIKKNKEFLFLKTDPFKHLRPGRRKKIVKEKIAKPIIRRITREIYVERMAIAEKPDGIPLKTLDGSGKVIAEGMVELDKYDGE